MQYIVPKVMLDLTRKHDFYIIFWFDLTGGNTIPRPEEIRSVTFIY